MDAIGAATLLNFRQNGLAAKAQVFNCFFISPGLRPARS